MKQFYTTIFIAAMAGILLLFTAGIKYTGGSPGARTGSPGDNNQNCTQCHSGTPQNAENWISSNIPASGYVPGSTYTITLSAAHDSQKFGFEATAERVGGQKAGDLVITNAAETKLVNNNDAVTHTSGGTSGSNSRTWSFDWTAPAEGSGPVTFYAAVNATNSNSGTSGDVVYLTQMAVEEVNTGIIESGDPSATLYPVPANQYLNVDLSGFNNQMINISVYASNGSKLMERNIMQNEVSVQTNRLMVDNLEQGYYLMKIASDETEFIKKFLISR